MSTTFSERLNRLFTALHPPGRGPYSSAEVIHALNQWGYLMSPPYLSQLRSGSRTHPSPQVVTTIAAFFGIPPEFFTDDNCYQRITQELIARQAGQQEGVRHIVERCIGLSAESREAVLQTIEELRSREGLED